MKKKILPLAIIVCLTAAVVTKIFLLLADKEQNKDVYLPIPKENVCIILTYHRVRSQNIWNTSVEKLTNNKELKNYSVYTDEFIKQIDYLKDAGAYFATLEELDEFRNKGEFPDKCVLISFDDVDISVYKNAFPVLKEKNIPFTLFIIAGHVGNKDFNNLELASWEQLREMKNSGLVSFGSHTYDMHYLEDDKASFLDEEMYEEFKEDIEKSREVLKNQLDVEVTSLAYPFGETTDQVARSVSEAGFTGAFILSPHPVDSFSNPYYQCRYLIDRENFYKIIVPWLE